MTHSHGCGLSEKKDELEVQNFVWEKIEKSYLKYNAIEE